MMIIFEMSTGNVCAQGRLCSVFTDGVEYSRYCLLNCCNKFFFKKHKKIAACKICTMYYMQNNMYNTLDEKYLQTGVLICKLICNFQI